MEQCLVKHRDNFTLSQQKGVRDRSNKGQTKLS